MKNGNYKRTFQALAACVAAALCGCGGAPSELEVKGLRLGMNIEDAARVMVGHGLPPGGPAEWDESESLIYARDEFEKARWAHYGEVLKAKADALGTATVSEFVRKVATPEEVRQVEQFGAFETFDNLTFEQARDVLSMWDSLRLPNFFEEGDRFPPMKEWLAREYPGGPPYAFGGPWNGEEPLKLLGKEGETRRLLSRRNWEFEVDPSGAVTRIVLEPAAVATLFNAGDLTGEEFAEAFASAYNVPLELTADVVHPEMAVLTGNPLRTSWAYADRGAGYAVTISEHKKLDISRVTKASEQAFD